jgi:hydrogenase expression/formation protein HypE
VAKSDPITFTAEDIGWYAVQINANDIATSGAQPRWFMAVLLLPEQTTDRALIDRIFAQIEQACREIEVTLIGGHTEITAGLDRPILIGTMWGEITKDRLITPRGASPGDILLLSKGIPIEACSILAREYRSELGSLPEELVERARNYLYDPGISVLPEARIAVQIGGVTCMHDPTEGGLLSGLWEVSDAAGVGLLIDEEAIPILPEAQALCQHLGVDPLAAIASGALLMTVEEERGESVCLGIKSAGINVTQIGVVIPQRGVWIKSDSGLQPLSRPSRDAIAELFERPRQQPKVRR